MLKSKVPKCECGVTVGCWFCERLDSWVCSICLDAEVAVLVARV